MNTNNSSHLGGNVLEVTAASLLLYNNPSLTRDFVNGTQLQPHEKKGKGQMVHDLDPASWRMCPLVSCVASDPQ